MKTKLQFNYFNTPIRIINWTSLCDRGKLEDMKITAIIKEAEGQLFIEFTGDMIDIIPVDEVMVTEGLMLHNEHGIKTDTLEVKLTAK